MRHEHYMAATLPLQNPRLEHNWTPKKKEETKQKCTRYCYCSWALRKPDNKQPKLSHIICSLTTHVWLAGWLAAYGCIHAVILSSISIFTTTWIYSNDSCCRRVHSCRATSKRVMYAVHVEIEPPQFRKDEKKKSRYLDVRVRSISPGRDWWTSLGKVPRFCLSQAESRRKAAS